MLWVITASLVSFIGIATVLSGKQSCKKLVYSPFSFPLLKKFKQKQAHKRLQQACAQEIPMFLDILVLGLSAGLSFDAALELYCTQVNAQLAGEMKRALLSWQMGVVSRKEALYALADALESCVLRQFTDSVVECLELGMPITDILKDQSSVLRSEQYAEVAKEIEKIPVKMLIPMGVFIVPALLLAILGPLLSGALQVTF